MGNGGARAGTQALTMAADTINRGILRGALDQPLQAPDGNYFETTARGREGLFVAFVLERWLQSAPAGPIPFSGAESELAVNALAEGWNSSVIHLLAQRPQASRELQRAADGLSRRALRRLLSAMHRCGQLEIRASSDAGDAVYAVTDWLRAGVAALIAAARIERRYPSAETAPIDARDVEASFMLALPLLELPQDLSGSCRLGVALDENPGAPIVDAGPGMAGVTAQVGDGRVVSCMPGLDLRADTWAAGTASDWLDTVIEPDAKRVRTGGDRRLAALLLNALNQTLFGVPTRR
jgi:DNA-binding HxlR family transcriptional regulator